MISPNFIAGQEWIFIFVILIPILIIVLVIKLIKRSPKPYKKNIDNFCTKCGARIENQNKFCTKCGTRTE